MNTAELRQVALIDELASVVAKLPRRENIFIGKLLKAFDAFGRLTPSQERVARSILAQHGSDYCDFWS